MRIIYILQMHFVNHIEIYAENRTIQNGIDLQLLCVVFFFSSSFSENSQKNVYTEKFKLESYSTSG